MKIKKESHMANFEPRYSISSKLLSNLKQIAVLAKELELIKPNKLVLREMEYEARCISSHTSTKIEGNPLPLTAVRQIMKSHSKYLRDSEKEVLNYNSALMFLNEQTKGGKILFSLKLINKIHSIVTKQLLPSFHSGKLRKDVVFVNNPKTGQTLFLPPDHKDVESLVVSLVEYVNKESQIDPIILAGIFHKQFVLIHPYMDGNGRTTRLVTKTLLARAGFNTFNLFSFENYYSKNVSKYFSKVGEFGDFYENSKNRDFTDWLEYFTDGIIDELFRVSGELQKNTNLELKALILKPHHHQIITHIEEHGYITDAIYATLTKRAKSSRNLDFRYLIKQKLIKQCEKGRATYYVRKQCRGHYSASLVEIGHP